MLKPNIALVAMRQVKGEKYAHSLVTRFISNKFTLSSKSSNVSYHFPLFISDSDSLLSTSPNINGTFLNKLHIFSGIELLDNEKKTQSIAIDVLGYIYAVLNSNSYREKYSDYLTKDFPRVPVPSKSLFSILSKLGGELVELHLFENLRIENFVKLKIGSGDFQVEKVSYSDNTVWIDKAKKRGFEGVPQEVWNFHIGGYQICEKWLKDRGPKKGNPGRILSSEDIEHYHKIVVALSETIRIMSEIDKVIEQHGGWPGAFQTERNFESVEPP
jgi:predicted helicase